MLVNRTAASLSVTWRRRRHPSWWASFCTPDLETAESNAANGDYVTTPTRSAELESVDLEGGKNPKTKQKTDQTRKLLVH